MRRRRLWRVRRTLLANLGMPKSASSEDYYYYYYYYY